MNKKTSTGRETSSSSNSSWRPSNINLSRLSSEIGSINSLTQDQELTLKQVWASILKYWGYDLAVPNSDLLNRDNYVSSSKTLSDLSYGAASLRSISKSSVSTGRPNDGSSIISSRRKNLFSKGRRLIMTQKSVCRTSNSKERSSDIYDPVFDPSDHLRNLYYHYNKDSYLEDGYESSDSKDAEASSFFSNTTKSTAKSEDDVTWRNNFPSGKHIQKNSHDLTLMGTFSKSCLRSDSENFRPKAKHILTHNTFILSQKVNNVDNYILNLAIVNGCDVQKTYKQFLKNMEWGQKEFPLHGWLMEGDAPSYLNGINSGFIKNFTVSKSYPRGKDLDGNTIFIFRSRLHFGSESGLAETKRFILLTIEWCKLLNSRKIDDSNQIVMLFDMTGFTLKNADYATIKFFIELIQEHYPEYLKLVLVHNAPWIFSIMWNIIKKWINPMLSAKIQFTKDLNELQKFASLDNIPSFLGGNDTYTFEYPIPGVKHGHPPKRKDDHYVDLRKKRDRLFMRFFESTIKWAETTSPEASQSYLEDKIRLSEELANNYVGLDPYVRNPGIFDREGTLKLY